jgi:hypothetical protein
MWELVPEELTENCFSKYGRPDFPHYQPCENDPGATGRPGAPGGLIAPCIYGKHVFTTPVPKVNVSNTTEKESTYKWHVQIWGDTAISGRTIYKGEVSGERIDIYDVPLTLWWWLSSPACPNMYCRFDTSVNRWGRDVINYHDQVDPNKTLHDGKPEVMHLSSNVCFVGHVSDEVIDHG